MRGLAELLSRIHSVRSVLPNLKSLFRIPKSHIYSRRLFLEPLESRALLTTSIVSSGESGRLFGDVSNEGIAAPLVINTLDAEGEEPQQPNDEVKYELRLLAAGTNTAITTVSIGQQFDLQLRVQDIRPVEQPAAQNARGVFTAYEDILLSQTGGATFQVGVPEIQTISILTTPASHAFTLTFKGQTTAAIAVADSGGNPLPADVTATNISTALQALSQIGAGNVLVNIHGNDFTVRFIGPFYNQDQPLMTSNDPADITITQLSPGDPGSFAEAFRSVDIPGVGGTGSNYQTLLSAAQTADRLDDVGATNVIPSGGSPGTGNQEFVRVRLIAGPTVGTITFTPDFQDLVPGQHATDIYTSPGANPIAFGTSDKVPARVSAVTDASHFTSANLLVYPTTVSNQLVGSTITFLNGPASVLEDDPSNPGGLQIKPVRKITNYDPATGAVTVDKAFPGVPLLQGQSGAVEDNAFEITLTTPVKFDFIGANPVSATITIVTSSIDAVNDTATTPEDTAVTIPVSTNDTTQPAGQSVVVTAIGTGANAPQHGSVSIAVGNVTYTPAKDFNGTDSFTYTAKNNTSDPTGANPDAATVTVTVTATNDAPTITAPVTQNVDDGGGTKTVTVTGIAPGPATAPDELASQTVTVTAVSDNPGVASTTSPLNGSNQLVLTGGAAGTAHITLTAVDNGTPNATTTVQFTVNVALVNQPPSFTKGGNQSFGDDSGAHTIPNWATNIMKGPVTAVDENSQTLDFIVTNSNNGLFDAQPSILPDGTLKVTPKPNTRGTATVTVSLHDSGGGNDTSPPETFTIGVTKDHPWYNAVKPFDTDANGNVQPLDALIVINYLNSGFTTTIAPTAPIGGGPGFLDTTKNNSVEPLDALLVINALNAGLGGEGEVQAPAPGDQKPQGSSESDLFVLLAIDAAEEIARRSVRWAAKS